MLTWNATFTEPAESEVETKPAPMPLLSATVSSSMVWKAACTLGFALRLSRDRPCSAMANSITCRPTVPVVVIEVKVMVAKELDVTRLVVVESNSQTATLVHPKVSVPADCTASMPE
jgi:hypothetical protein